MRIFIEEFTLRFLSFLYSPPLSFFMGKLRECRLLDPDGKKALPTF